MSPEPGRDPNYILSQDEFHQTIAALARRGDFTQHVVKREASELRRTAGWFAISLAFWLLLAGYGLLRGRV